MDPAAARRFWRLIEPIHAVTYFSPEAQAAYADAGLRGFWRGYFAGRVAPLGPVGPAVVTAMFNGFAPDMVARALPAIWQIVTPAQALEARSAGAVAALRRLIDADVAEVADAVEAALVALPTAGRPLGAANAALPRPDGDYARLWQAVTTLREHRGDGHIAALVAFGIEGLSALVLRAALDLGRETLQPNRGWTDAQWDAATLTLQGRGLLEDDGSISDQGRSALELAESVTDFAAAPPWALVTGEVESLLAPIAVACAAELPAVNPIGLIL